MKTVLQYIAHLIALVIWTAIGFCSGAFVTGWVCVWLVVPVWVKMYPHDGQLGLGVACLAVAGGAVTALIMFGVGLFLAEKVFPVRKQPYDKGNNTSPGI